jgi:hypothetical protein
LGAGFIAMSSVEMVHVNDEKNFMEFRRKVRASEVLSASVERLLLSLQFTGRITIVLQNGRVLKSGYEEGYFRRHGDASI